MYVTCPLALGSLLSVLVYSHVAMPTAYESLAHFFRVGRTGGAPGGGKSLLEESDSILTSELASPLVS